MAEVLATTQSCTQYRNKKKEKQRDMVQLLVSSYLNFLAGHRSSIITLGINNLDQVALMSL